MTKEKTTTKEWEDRDRVYYLKGDKTPISFTLASRHTSSYPLLWFDEEKGYARELRYATNQKSSFVDEQEGYATLAHIVFKDGTLVVPRSQKNLQQLLSLYHPQYGQTYVELDTVKEAVDELESIEMEITALNLAKSMELEQAESILRVELGSQVSKMGSQEIKRDILLFAKRDPKLFIDLANDDNVMLRNIAIKAVENKVIALDGDQRTFKWASNGKKLMTVPFDENPYSAMAAFFKTDEGMEIYKSIEKKLK